MGNLTKKLIVIASLAIAFGCSVLIAEMVTTNKDVTAVAETIISDDFRIDVETNKDVYHNRDVLRLSVKLLNNSPKGTYVVRTLNPMPAELEDSEIVDVCEGILDCVDVDVAIMPWRPIIIGYATLTRLGPSPVPYPVPLAEETEIVKPKPIKFLLPLFGPARIPGHSTRIISTANILIRCPFLIEAVEAEPLEAEPAELAEAEPIEIIPAIACCRILRPGYYLLDCHINKIAGAKAARAQKIIQIRRRILQPILLPEPLP